jgi:LacI family transcriptional regulator
VQSVERIRQQKVPVVVLDRRVPDAQADVVRCDSEGGACELGRLLHSLGHRRIAILSGPSGISTADDRVAGFRRALAAAGAPEGCRVYHGEFTQESGAAMTRQALAECPRPTALFATNNFIAIGALRALRDAGLRVPEDVALVGFDDLPAGLVTFPFLTVAAQPAYEMGRKAVAVLLERLAGDVPEELREIVLPTELVVRRSSGGAVSPKET